MTDHDKSFEFEGLKFFGKINASISHEIRNTLAVINENAGLVKDLIMMSEKGYPLDVAKIGEKVQKVLDQVKRSDKIVDNMNRFAHSIDSISSTINICEYAEFVVRLSERFATMKGVQIKPELPSYPIEISTFPFMLENMVYLCIDYALQNPKEEKIISVSAEKKEDAVQIEFKGISASDEAESDFTTEAADMLGKLGARIIIKKESGSFILEIKKEPGKQEYNQGGIL
jgi:light-regulated signal transduction histidine kinase (bacteriophytochrome)